jgi:hypothetical protein
LVEEAWIKTANYILEWKARQIMLNPFGPQQDSGSYVNLQRRMLQRVQSANINDQIFEVVQKAYENAIEAENIVLSRPERKRLLSQILKLVLENMIEKLNNHS